MFLAAILIIPVPGANAEAPIVSGTVQLGNSLQYGSTSYSVKYSYPSTVNVGSNLTITVSLHVVSLTGLVEYISSYGFVADVFVGSQHLQGSVYSALNATYLYPGSSWGPNNVTIPLTANNTGLAEGQSANASVSITQQDTVFYGGQAHLYTTEPGMQGAAGSLLVQNRVASSSTSTTVTGTGQSYVPYAILTASGAVLMLVAAVWPRRPPSM